MVKIKHVNENFINNDSVMNLTIPYNENDLSTVFHVDEEIIKKAKVSCVISGCSNITLIIMTFLMFLKMIMLNMYFMKLLNKYLCHPTL